MLYILLGFTVLILILLVVFILSKHIQKKYIIYAKLYIIAFLLLFIYIVIQLIKDHPVTTHQKIAKTHSSRYAQMISKETSVYPNNIQPLSSWAINIEEEILLDVPILSQLPELPRGCEVTSLAMLLQHAGQPVDKLTLAKQIKKEKGYIIENGKKIYGNPHVGFVGDMYSLNTFGLGVYHEPIKELAETYAPGQIHDFSGSDFDEILFHLNQQRPVWVIINTLYKKLDDSYFQIWETKNGPISITYKEHSVVITGYDDEYIYFNDPLTYTKNKKAPIQDFMEAWVQMGSQAITITK